MATRPLARVGDPTSHGAVITASNQAPADFVFSDSIAVAVLYAPIQTHYYPPHVGAVLVTLLSDFIFIENAPVALNGSVASCGAVVVATSEFDFGE